MDVIQGEHLHAPNPTAPPKPHARLARGGRYLYRTPSGDVPRVVQTAGPRRRFPKHRRPPPERPKLSRQARLGAPEQPLPIQEPRFAGVAAAGRRGCCVRSTLATRLVGGAGRSHCDEPFAPARCRPTNPASVPSLPLGLPATLAAQCHVGGREPDGSSYSHRGVVLRMDVSTQSAGPPPGEARRRPGEPRSPGPDPNMPRR